MANITVIPGQVEAVAAQQMVDATSYTTIMLVAFGLATTEVATVYVMAGGVWVPLADRAGVAVTLTATAPQVALEGGAIYGVTKDATAGLAGVDAIVQHFSFG